MKLNFKKYPKIILINLISLTFIFLFLEVISRVLFPQNINEVFRRADEIDKKGLTRGITFWEGKFNGNTKLNRISHNGAEVNTDSPLFIILGDSVSAGFGSAYEDIYWVKLQRIYDLDPLNQNKILFLSLGGYGNNLQDSDKTLNEFITKNKNTIKYIFYQFNFNDVTPFLKKDLKAVEAKRSPLLKFSEFRYQYLNKSVFLRLSQMYLAPFARKTNGSCKERGLDAMGGYTWTFGHESFRKESLELWEKFENNLKRISEIAKTKGAKFIIFISPILFDIDTEGIHPFYNRQNFDFSCSTINPRKKLRLIADQYGALIIDPTLYIKDRFERRNKEGNFSPLYFPGDENHFNPLSAQYISEYLYFSIFRNIK